MAIRTTFVAAAIVAFAGAANAQPLAGHLELGIGGWGDGYGGYGVFTSAARVNKQLHDTWNLEVEAVGEAQFSGGYAQPTNVGAYAHLWNRTPSKAYGVFGGVSFLGLTTGTIGVEAKHFFAKGTLGGQASYNFSQYFDYGQVAVFGNYYIDPNHRLGLRAQYSFDVGGGPGTWELTADAEHGFGNGWSLWGSASYIDSYGYGLWRGLVGFRLFLDEPGATIQSHEWKVPWAYRQQFLGPVKRVIALPGGEQ